MRSVLKRKTLSAQEEAVLHEKVAQTDSHEAQTKGIVGWFYRFYIEATVEFVKQSSGLVLDVGSGEGMIFKESGLYPVQLDISLSRLTRARRYSDALVCADAYAMPLRNESFDTVLLIALLEHTSDPRRILTEAHRVLRPGGHMVVVVPNDVNMSIGRLLLCKWPPRYPDHLTFFTPARLRQWTQNLFSVERGYPMPFKRMSFWLNMYYFAILKKLA